MPLHAPPRRGRVAQRFAFACASTSQEPSRSSSEHSPPPRPLYALLRLYRSRVGLAPTLLLLDRLRRFSRLCEGQQLSAQLFTLLLRRFSSAAFPFKLSHHLASFILERGL